MFLALSCVGDLSPRFGLVGVRAFNAATKQSPALEPSTTIQFCSTYTIITAELIAVNSRDNGFAHWSCRCRHSAHTFCCAHYYCVCHSKFLLMLIPSLAHIHLLWEKKIPIIIEHPPKTVCAGCRFPSLVEVLASAHVIEQFNMINQHRLLQTGVFIPVIYPIYGSCWFVRLDLGFVARSLQEFEVSSKTIWFVFEMRAVVCLLVCFL